MQRYFMNISIFLIAALLYTYPAHATGEVDLKATVATLEGGYRLLKDLQADFSQKTTIESMKRDEKGNGELSLKRPANAAAMFRFDYKKPRQTIVSDGKQVWFHIPDNKQVMISDAKAIAAQGGVALNYLTGIGNVSKDFKATLYGKGKDDKGNYLLELVPIKGGQAFAKLQLTISGKAVDSFKASGATDEPFPILASIVYDQMGNRTTIEYRRIKVNQGIGSDKFKFKIPPDVEVIKP